MNIENCYFINNRASQYGGSIFLQNIITLNIKNSKFIYNTASQGGAIYYNDISKFYSLI